ncbi:hypothetical protein DFH29DRAFT_881025 [Suillus ampliporus]|nr:hypothetical protein DFH29DRAFT_881025 [Suillus ampliporus]
MSYVSNDPTWLPLIYHNLIMSYFCVVSVTVVVYDWALTFGQEPSTKTALTVRTGLGALPWDTIFCGFSHSRSQIKVVNAMLGVLSGMASISVSGRHETHARISVELVLFGIHKCGLYINADEIRLHDATLIPTVVWEILALFLAAWIVIKHFHELRQSPTGSTIGDCFTVLIRSHVLYFIVIVPFFTNIQYSSSMGAGVYYGILNIITVVQMFVLGPHLILSVREYHAKLVTDSDEGIGITTIAFGEGGRVSTGGDV